jgi:hypothetical protein
LDAIAAWSALGPTADVPDPEALRKGEIHGVLPPDAVIAVR